MKMTRTSGLALALIAVAPLVSAQESNAGCSPTGPCPLASSDPREFGHHGRDGQVVRTWDPYLAQWRVERPGRVWDPNLARYQYERRDQVWDPYLAQYRPRDARKDPPAAVDRQPERQGDGHRRR